MKPGCAVTNCRNIRNFSMGALEGDNLGKLDPGPGEDNSAGIQTTQAVLTLDTLNRDDNESFISEASETPESCRSGSAVAAMSLNLNAVWNTASSENEAQNENHDGNNNIPLIPISQRPRMPTPPLPLPQDSDSDEDELDGIYRVSDFQTCGRCNVQLRGAEIKLSRHPVCALCTPCKMRIGVRAAQSLLEAELGEQAKLSAELSLDDDVKTTGCSCVIQ